MNGSSLEGQRAGAWSSGLKQRLRAVVVVVVEVVMARLVVSVVVLSGVTDSVPEVVEDTRLMLEVGAVMVDSVADTELGGARMEKLKSGSICFNVIVAVTTTIFGSDWLFDLLDESAEKGSPTVAVKVGTMDVGKQPRPMREILRHKGTFGGQHCGSGQKVLVQFGEMLS